MVGFNSVWFDVMVFTMLVFELGRLRRRPPLLGPGLMHNHLSLQMKILQNIPSPSPKNFGFI